MRVACGDLWSYLGTHLIVVPTNIGYIYRPDPAVGAPYVRNVMGRGVAEQAKARFQSRDLDGWYGEQCRRGGADTPVMECPFAPLIMFPTKPFIAPAAGERSSGPSWRGASSMSLVLRSIRQLKDLPVTRVALPLVGTGNGRLPVPDVLSALAEELDDRFLLVVEPRAQPAPSSADGF